jgi:hypothetical protein
VLRHSFVAPSEVDACINAAREIDRSLHRMRIIVIRRPTVPEVDGLDLRSRADRGHKNVRPVRVTARSVSD